MKKVLLLLIAVLMNCYFVFSQPVYQLPNGNFNNWPDNVTVPDGWHTFNTASGSFNSLVNPIQHSRAADRTGGTNCYSCKIYPKKVMGIATANGNFTTGRVNAGSMSASDVTGNYNYSDITGGYCQSFVGYPATSSSVKARLSAIIHGNYSLHDPADDETKVVASAYSEFARTTSSENGIS